MELPLQLTRPLCILDIEATGLDTIQDRIVSLTILKLTPCDLLQQSSESWYDQLFDPGFPMSEEVIEIHGITNEMVKGKPAFRDEARKVMAFLRGCDLCGFNVDGFDNQILWESFHRDGVEWDLEGVNSIDAGTLFKIRERRDLAAAVKFYCNQEHVDAHSSKGDVLATAQVLAGQLWRYDDLTGLTVEALAKLTKQDERLDLAGVVVIGKSGKPEFTHKKVRGVKVEDDPGYARWILRSDFSDNTKAVIAQLLAEYANS